MQRSEKIRTYEFSGPLAEPIERFIAEKRGLGFVYNATSKALARFDRFTVTVECERGILSKELAEAYAMRKKGDSVHTHRQRMLLLNQLGEYMQSHGYSAHILDCRGRSQNNNEYIPYIFTREEMARIFEQADLCRSHTVSPYRDKVIPLLFRILYGCGLRVSEVLELKVGDVDAANGILTIRGAKFDKDRLVPMTESLSGRCKEYLAQMHSQSDDNNIFFPNVYSEAFSTGAIYYTFRCVLSKAGISHGGKGNGPRVHDLRHTFAVHCLKRWVLEMEDVTGMLTFLAAYLGHTKMYSTSRYLRLTMDLFPEITNALESKLGDIVPKMEVFLG